MCDFCEVLYVCLRSETIVEGHMRDFVVKLLYKIACVNTEEYHHRRSHA